MGTLPVVKGPGVPAAYMEDAARTGWAFARGAVDLGLVRAIAEEAARLPFERLIDAPRVRQRGRKAVPAPEHLPAGWALAMEIAEVAGRAGFEFQPNELMLQSYSIGEGVSGHRDSAKYRQAIVIVEIEGTGFLRSSKAATTRRPSPTGRSSQGTSSSSTYERGRARFTGCAASPTSGSHSRSGSTEGSLLLLDV